MLIFYQKASQKFFLAVKFHTVQRMFLFSEITYFMAFDEWVRKREIGTQGLGMRHAVGNNPRKPSKFLNSFFYDRHYSLAHSSEREDLRIFDLACYSKISNSRYCLALKWISMYLWCQILSANKNSLTLQRAAFGVQINISTFA